MAIQDNNSGRVQVRRESDEESVPSVPRTRRAPRRNAHQVTKALRRYVSAGIAAHKTRMPVYSLPASRVRPRCLMSVPARVREVGKAQEGEVRRRGAEVEVALRPGRRVVAEWRRGAAAGVMSSKPRGSK